MSRHRLARAGALVLAGTTLARAHANARDVPLSPVLGDGYVGPDWVDREGIGREPKVGEMDDMADYSRPDFDPDRVDDEVRRFYERTTEYRMRYRVRWHHPFRVGARLAARGTSRLEQLNLPTDSRVRELENDIVAVSSEVDPRNGARAWTRTDPETGEAVFVAVYGSHVHDGERYTNIAVAVAGEQSLHRASTRTPGVGAPADDVRGGASGTLSRHWGGTVRAPDGPAVPGVARGGGPDRRARRARAGRDPRDVARPGEISHRHLRVDVRPALNRKNVANGVAFTRTFALRSRELLSPPNGGTKYSTSVFDPSGRSGSVPV